MRRLLSRILGADERILVVGSASDGSEVLGKIDDLLPDVITLDVNMPGLNGIESLRLIREIHKTLRVIMCSSETERGASITLDALMAGASDYVTKPAISAGTGPSATEFARAITEKVCGVARIRGVRRDPSPPAGRARAAWPMSALDRRTGVLSADATPSPGPRLQRSPEVLVIGSSTGGPSALSEIFALLPKDFPLPILIVQHMPPLFTRLFAERLSRLSHIPVIEAESGTEVRPGVALLAPGNFHMRIVQKLHRVEVVLTQEEPENSCRPAVDVLFRSVAEVYGNASIAMILTGMGQDGLQGIRSLKALGSTVLVQDQATSTVWGMPRAVAEAGLADMVLPLQDFVPELLRLL
jgi:two-component system chemotaxis response regulator CheB